MTADSPPPVPFPATTPDPDRICCADCGCLLSHLEVWSGRCLICEAKRPRPASDAPAPPRHNEVYMTEHPRKTVYVHETAISTDAPTMTAPELLIAARIEVGRSLWIERGDGVPEDRRIGDDEAIGLRDGMRFYSVPLGTF